MNMYFVYILESQVYQGRYYVGVTRDVERRLVDHNAGNTSHTKKYRPWSLKNYIAFSSEQAAYAFELYLKTGSGRAFCKRHFDAYD
ncbi:MAG: putative endonuclease [Candidatus Dependentiae bacterium]|nr:putative endonuclease [Candidatus Dependentiae bacterium]